MDFALLPLLKVLDVVLFRGDRDEVLDKREQRNLWEFSAQLCETRWSKIALTRAIDAIVENYDYLN